MGIDAAIMQIAASALPQTKRGMLALASPPMIPGIVVDFTAAAAPALSSRVSQGTHLEAARPLLTRLPWS